MEHGAVFLLGIEINKPGRLTEPARFAKVAEYLPEVEAVRLAIVRVKV